MIHVLAVLLQNRILAILGWRTLGLFHPRYVGGCPGLGAPLAGWQGWDAPEEVVLGRRLQESRTVLC